MKLRRMIRVAAFVWGAYRMYSRSRHTLRSNAKHALKRAQKAI